MPTYTSTSNVDELLPASLPSSVTSADKARWVADASAMVDGLVGPRYPMLSTNQKFADVSDSPATPSWIELCARWLAAYFGFVQLREINKTDKLPSQATTYYNLAVKNLEKIREGKVDIFDSDGSDLASGEQIWSSTEERDATFTRGVYIDGDLDGDEGTLDDFEIA